MEMSNNNKTDSVSRKTENNLEKTLDNTQPCEREDLISIPDSLNNLSEAFFDQLKPGIYTTEEKFKNVAENQRVMIESLKQENEKLWTISKLEDVETSMALIEHYRKKLLVIKKDMNQIKETSTRLKRDATHLVNVKKNAQLRENDRKKREALAEYALTAKFEKS